MQLWDYFILKLEMQEDGQWRTLFQEGWTTLDEILPDMGKNGWELISSTLIGDPYTSFLFGWQRRNGTNRLLMIFKRPSASASA